GQAVAVHVREIDAVIGLAPRRVVQPGHAEPGGASIDLRPSREGEAGGLVDGTEAGNRLRGRAEGWRPWRAGVLHPGHAVTVDHALIEQAVAVDVDEDRRQLGTVADGAELGAGRQVFEGAEGDAEIEMGLVGGIALARERGAVDVAREARAGA